MKKLLCLLVLLLPMVAHAATVGAVASTNRLMQFVNPNTDLTNYFVMSDVGVIADGSAAIWTYDASSNMDDTNHIKPLLYGGRWVRNPMGGTNSYSFLVGVTQTNYTIIGRTNVTVTQVISGTNSTIYLDSGGAGVTNFFDTTIITNVDVVQNITVRGRAVFNDYVTINTNLYITTNTFIVNNGSTNAEGLWISTNGVYQQVFQDQPIDFGLGLTNLLYRNGNALVYSNAAPTVIALGPSGQIVLSENSGAASVSTTEPDLAFQAGASRELHFNSSTRSFTPDVTGETGFIEGIQLGDSGHFWTNGWFEGTLYINGLWDEITTDYSRLAISHGGPDDGIHFDSQSAGIAGPPVSQKFDLGGTNAVQIYRNSGTQSRLKVFSPDQNTQTWLSSDNGAVSGLGSTGALTLFGSGFNVTLQSGNMQPTSAMDLGSTSFPWNTLFLGSADLQISFGSTNTAPSNPTTPIFWAKVAITGDTNSYRIPIYK